MHRALPGWWSVHQRCASVVSLASFLRPHVRTQQAAQRGQMPILYRSSATARLSVPQRTFSSATHVEDEDDFLQAYEELILNASAQTDDSIAATSTNTAAGVVAADGAMLDVSAGVEKRESPIALTDDAVPAVDVLVEDALTLLPADGAPVQLTDLTPLLDLEAISERFGSARNFFLLYPHRFSCTQDAATKRWWVRRAARAHAAAEPVSQMHATPKQDADDAPSLDLVDVGELSLKEDLAQLHSHPLSTPRDASRDSSVGVSRHVHKPAPRRLTAVRDDVAAAAAAAASDENSNALWSTVATLLPQDGSPMSIAQLRLTLPSDVVQRLRTTGIGLARCFKQEYNTAHTWVSLSADSLSMMRAAVTHASHADGTAHPLLPLWLPPALLPLPSATAGADITVARHDSGDASSSAKASLEDGVYVPVPMDAISAMLGEEAEAWWVEVPFEDSEERHDAPDHPLREDPMIDGGTTMDAATGFEEVPYHGPDSAHGGTQGSGVSFSDASLLRGLDVELLRCAPAVPRPRLPDPLPAPPSDGSVAQTAPPTKKKTRVPRPSTPEEWIALHTAMAAAQGWLTPPQMLDYLVECVPTFFVPLDEVRISDALAKLVGPRTSMRTLVTRIYMYYMEKSEDGARVRLAESLEHPQRGVANVHYAAWDTSRQWTATANSGEWHADRATDVRDASCPASKILQSSDATRAFPVMRVHRPIKSALPCSVPRTKRTPAVLPSTASSAVAQVPAQQRSSCEQASTAVPSASPLSTSAQASALSLSSVPTTEIGYPFKALATQPVSAWPWWAHLLCVLPYDTYIPLNTLEALLGRHLTAAEVDMVWRASESTMEHLAGKVRSIHPFPFTLLRPPPGATRQVRLRPFWLAPGCTAELDSASLPADVVRQLRPVWMPVSRLLKKLSPTSREAALALALRRMPGAACSVDDAFVSLLRDSGRCCWVNQAGTKVRRYAAAHEMDDIFHMALSLLYGFASTHVWEPVAMVLARAAKHVQPLCTNPSSCVAGSPYEVGLVGMLHHAPAVELRAFLKRHVQYIDVKEASAAEAAGSDVPQLLVRRRAAFASFHEGSV